MEDAVKSSRLVNKQAESICHQPMVKTPLETATILQDLKVLPQLKNVRITAGDLSILPNRGWGREMRSSPIVPYSTLQEILEELKTLPDTYDEEKWMKFSKPFLQHNANMDTAKLIRTMIPDIVCNTHRTVTGLIAQLSQCVQECLRAGLPIQTIEDALDRKLQEANYTFASKD